MKHVKIGIRPIIDSRQLVKEALNEMTMELSRGVAELLSGNLKYPDGTPVECIINETCISGAAEAAQAHDHFVREGVGIVISVAAGWCYPLETMEFESAWPHAIWGFNGTERPGAVYLAALHSAHVQKGLPAFKIYGRDVQDQNERAIPDDVQSQLLRFARAALAAVSVRGSSYLSIGGVSMGISGCVVDESFFTDYLGMRNGYVDMVEVSRRIDKGVYDPEELEKALSWVKVYCKEGEDPNPPELQLSPQQKEEDWKTSILMAMIVRDMMVGNPKLREMGYAEASMGYNAVAAGFQGQRAWTDHKPCGDFMEAILNSSFDWNGIRKPYIVATENDNLNAVTMLFGHLLTNSAQIFADVRSYWSPEALKKASGWEAEGAARNGFIHLINSGPAALDGTGRQTIDGKPAMKPHWEITPEEAEACLSHTEWRPVYGDQFFGGGYSSNFLTAGGMPVTMTRINLVDGSGPVLQIAEGYTVELPDHVHHVLNDRTTPTWPTTWFVPRLEENNPPFADVFSVMKEWGSNHCVLSYGHIGADLITLASILRIPVNMHNVPVSDILRPSLWSAMGTRDLEGADYRACRLLGPLYK